MSKYKKNQRFGYFLIISLAISTFAISISNSLITLLSVDIAATFQLNQGFAVQLRTVNYLGELILGLLLGFIALRFKDQSMLKWGLLIVALSAVGSSLTPSFPLFLIFSFIEGVGSLIVTVMALSLIGDYFHSNPKRQIQAVSLIGTSGFLFGLIGLPVTNFLAQNWGWRSGYLYLVLPINLIALCLFFLNHHFTEFNTIQRTKKKLNFKEVKQVLFTKSIFMFLTGWLLFAGTASVGILAIALYREKFFLSTDFAVFVILAVNLIGILGSLLIAKFAKQSHLKFLSVGGVATSGVCTALLFLSPNYVLALIFNLSTAFFMSISTCSFNCLAINKIPKLKETVLALSRFSFGAGSVIFSTLAGFLLIQFSSIGIGYQVAGIVLGLSISIGALFLMISIKDKGINENSEN